MICNVKGKKTIIYTMKVKVVKKRQYDYPKELPEKIGLYYCNMIFGHNRECGVGLVTRFQVANYHSIMVCCYSICLLRD